VPLSSGEIPAVPDDDVVDLGELSGGAGSSGINLQDPADSGISLEQGSGSDELDFELTLDAGSTPKPSAGGKGAKSSKSDKDSSDEFELSIQDDDSPTEAGSSSEFELSLDAESSPDLEKVDSDSEFELTLDEEGSLAPVEEDADEKDIFETDFEVPALDDESGSEAVVLEEDSDTDLEENSDFELALNEGDVEADEDSGSQVVALEDEEDADDAAATIARPRKLKPRRPAITADDDEGLELEVDLDAEDEEAELEEEPVGALAAPAPPPEWGAMPGVVMIFSVLFLFVVGLMGFELVQGMLSYQKTGKFSGLVTNSIAGLIEDPPKE
jgi:hypothetical protein